MSAPCRKGARPQLVFHGAEPLLARDAVFAGIEKYGDYFRFGVQTNATQLDREALEFLRDHGCGIGISLDGPTEEIATRTRRTWGGSSVFAQTVKILEELHDYPGLERHHHRHQGKRPVPPGTGGVFP